MRSHARVSLQQRIRFRIHFLFQKLTSRRNTRSTSEGIKTRSFAAIFKELSLSLSIHSALGSFLGGVHLELTGDAVTECTGGSVGLEDKDLGLRYETFCDPRLNEKQALELAFLVAGHQRKRRSSVRKYSN